ncbi:MAG: hypothetical protein RJA57_1491 [Bacteroidota bacterium]
MPFLAFQPLLFRGGTYPGRNARFFSFQGPGDQCLQPSKGFLLVRQLRPMGLRPYLQPAFGVYPVPQFFQKP